VNSKRIVKLDIAFYADSPGLAREKMEAILDLIDGAMDCSHFEGSEDAPCNMVTASGQIMTEKQYDEWFDREYPEL
jgi:hypothetical protein